MENRATINELLGALRCSATTGQHDCTKCRYRLLEEVDDKFPAPPDCEVDGVKYWESCDCDGMVLEAADMIEELRDKLENLQR